MVGLRLLQIASLYMVIALALGLAMGISGNFLFSSIHAHLSLLGWATMALAGLMYMALPACAASRLAALHFWGHNAGLPIMTVGLVLKEYGNKQVEPVIGAGSVIVLVSLLVFAANLFRNGGAGDPART